MVPLIYAKGDYSFFKSQKEDLGSKSRDDEANLWIKRLSCPWELKILPTLILLLLKSH